MMPRRWDQMARAIAEQSRAFGKRTPGGLYLAYSGYWQWHPALRGAFMFSSSVVGESPIPPEVVKFALDGTSISWLYYPELGYEAFPTLSAAIVVDLLTGATKHISYMYSVNQPVLHRKELLLPPDDASYCAWARVTARAEELGLYDEPPPGTALEWAKVLRKHRVVVKGHQLQLRKR